MTKQISTSLVITVVPLAEEVLHELVSNNLVLARITSESPSFVMELMDLGNWEQGTGLLSTFTDSTIKSPAESACKIIDSFGLTSVENLRADEQTNDSQSDSDAENSRLWISKVEIYGATATPDITKRFTDSGFKNIQNTELGCVALRDETAN